MPVADLHVHTTNSDGSLTLETLPAAAARADLDAVAVTDHDRLHPTLDGPIVSLDGITIVHGIELRVQSDGQRLDLLGYGAEPTEPLVDLVEYLQRDRVQRAQAIVDCVEDRLDVDLDIALKPGVGRPHIARAIAASQADLDYEGAFAELIGDDCPCFVARDVPSFDEGAEILSEACSVVGLAHPFRYGDPMSALQLARDLDAVEVHYPYSLDVDVTPAIGIAREDDLLITGGSDAHDETLGRAGLDRETYARLRDCLNI